MMWTFPGNCLDQRRAIPEVRNASHELSFPHRVGSSLAQTRNVLKRIIECLRTSNIMYTYPVISVQI